MPCRAQWRLAALLLLPLRQMSSVPSCSHFPSSLLPTDPHPFLRSTKFCCGVGNLSNEEAQKEAKKWSYNQWTDPMKDQLKRGPTGKPWVTIFAQDEFRDENFIFLPLMVPDGMDMDVLLVKEVRTRFSSLERGGASSIHESPIETRAQLTRTPHGRCNVRGSCLADNVHLHAHSTSEERDV